MKKSRIFAVILLLSLSIFSPLWSQSIEQLDKKLGYTDTKFDYSIAMLMESVLQHNHPIYGLPYGVLILILGLVMLFNNRQQTRYPQVNVTPEVKKPLGPTV